MKIAVMTGTSSGMGRETIIQLWERFKDFDEIWIIARRRERLDELDRQVGVPLRKFALDLTRERNRDMLLRALSARKPQVRFLVNAASFGMVGQVEELGLKSETDMIALNCEALYAVTRMVLPYAECNSQIIQYASPAAFLSQPGFAICAATKSFVLSYSRALNRELRNRRIYVTTVCPGPVKTEFSGIAKSTGVIPLYKRLVIANPKRVVQKVIRDSVVSRKISVYGVTVKAFRLLCRTMPHRLLLVVMSFMNDWLPIKECRHMQTLTVTQSEVGQRLDKFLTRYLNQAGRGFIYKMIHEENMTLNDEKCDGSERLGEGDQVKLFLSDETIERFSVPDMGGYEEQPGDQSSTEAPSHEKREKTRGKGGERQGSRDRKGGRRLDIIYEGQHILVVNKPSGILSQKAEDSGISLSGYILNYPIDSGKLPISQLRTFKPSICNRLGKSTSGLVVAGKSLTGLQAMNEVFKDRSIYKYYQCPVADEIKEKQLTAGFLKEDESTDTVSIFPLGVKGSIPIMTEYLPLPGNKTFTLLQITLITRRNHQIRVHLASIGHPIIGDYRYGSHSLNGAVKERYVVQSQLLHPWWLVMLEALPVPLKHLRGEEFTARLPVIFNTVMEKEEIGLPCESQGI